MAQALRKHCHGARFFFSPTAHDFCRLMLLRRLRDNFVSLQLCELCELGTVVPVPYKLYHTVDGYLSGLE